MNKTKERINFFDIDIEKFENKNTRELKNAVKILNKDKLLIISGIKNSGKLNFIKLLINKTGTKTKFLYFNKQKDYKNLIKSNKDLENSLNDYIQLYKKPNIVVLNNTSKIEGIKDFIIKLYKENYKVILVGNEIKIEGIKEIEIQNTIKNIDKQKEIKYGNFNEIYKLANTKTIESLLKYLQSDIILHDIFKNFSIKNIELYIYSITYLAKNSISLSLREIESGLNKNNNISLKTTIDYIEYSIQSKILRRCYRYDFKKDKEITTKAKYYFNDNGLRNSFYEYKVNIDILNENYIFNILYYNKYTIYNGLNGKFEFSFYAIKGEGKIFIHISEARSKDELKKEINKLNKIGIAGKKYLIIKSKQDLAIQKVRYEEVEIVELEDFVEKFKR